MMIKRSFISTLTVDNTIRYDVISTPTVDNMIKDDFISALTPLAPSIGFVHSLRSRGSGGIDHL